ncbi:hypothetical protein ACR79T_10830 [Sphingobacterium spiritivorum]|uniref:hypothetical protein n=1 Tax=Sphingobacterium spiritivorum TaxID=258 RepID=UPI003DA415E0
MRHTENQIRIIALKILKDIDGQFYRENCIDSIMLDEKDKISRGVDKGKIKPTWTIFIKSLFDNEDHLIISDETGEPVYYQNFNYIIREIGKDANGKYYRIKD